MPYEFQTNSSNLAISISNDFDDTDAARYLRVIFYQTRESDGEDPVLIPAINCTDFYSQTEDEDDKTFFEYIFGTDGLKRDYYHWVCPQVNKFSILNDKEQLIAQVLPCDQAKSLMEDNPSPAYEQSDECLSYSELESAFN